MDIKNEDKEKLEKYKNIVDNILYQYLEKLLSKIIDNNKAIDTLQNLENVNKEYTENKKNIEKWLDTIYFKKDKYIKEQRRIKQIKIEFEKDKKYEKIVNVKDFILREDIKKLESYNIISDYNVDEIIKKKISIDEQEKTYKKLIKGNKIIEALSELVSKKSGIYKYKQEENEVCPLCNSSDKFSEISEDDICKTAREYIDKSDRDIEALKNKIDIEKENFKFEVEQLKESIIQCLDENISKNDEKLSENEINKEKYKLVLKFILENKNIKYNESLCELLEKNIIIFKRKIINDESLETIKQEAIEINKGFNSNLFKDDFSEIEIDSNKFGIRVEDKVSYREIEIDVIINKKISIQNYLNDSIKLENVKLIKKDENYKEYLEYIQTKIATTVGNKGEESKEERNREKKVPKSIKDTLELFSKFEKLIQDRKKLNEDEIKLNKEGIEHISENLNKMFKKLTKDIKDINLKIDVSSKAKKEGKAILKGDKSNAMNILSQGQVSVLMISYFLNNLFYNDKVKVKLCLFDDITHSLDDLNINSFIDMLKYSLCGKNKKLSQLFFTTHDKNLIELIKIKMHSRDITYEVIDLDNLE